MKDLTPFSLKQILRKSNSINVQINLEHRKIFPKERYRLLSWYQYKRRFVDISPHGYFSFFKLTTSLIDFSFVKSLVAPHTKDVEDTVLILPLFLYFIFVDTWMGSRQKKTLFPASMIKIKDDATEPMQEYPMIASPVSLTLLISKSELDRKSSMISSTS